MVQAASLRRRPGSMLKSSLRTLKRVADRALGQVGYEIAPVGRHNWEDQESFIPLAATLDAARNAGLSVGDYIDTVMNGTPGATQATIDGMARLGVFANKGGTVVEIGPGSGRYLERVIAACAPSRYEIYETATAWAQYVAARHSVVVQPTDGYALAATPSASVDLVHAHKVFSSIHFMPTCCCWAEMARVVRPGGFCVFDIMTERCLAPEQIDRWAKSGLRSGSYPAATPREAAVGYLASLGFRLVGSFLAPMGLGSTEVMVFAKR